MAAATTIALIGAGIAAAGAVQQSEAARTAKKDAKRETNRQIQATRQAEATQVEKEKVMDEQTRQRQARQKQRAAFAAGQGRQSTILGGAGDVGNAGNQAQAGAGKTLLGV